MKKSRSECCDAFLCSGHILTKRGSSCSRNINRNNLSCNTLLEIKFLTSAGWVRLSPTEGTEWLGQTQVDLLEPITVMLILLGLCKAQLMPTCLQILLLLHLLSWHWRLKLPVLSVSQLVEVRWVGRCCTGAVSPATGAGAAWGGKQVVILSCCWSGIIGLVEWKGRKEYMGPEPGSDDLKSLQYIQLLFGLWAVSLAACSHSPQLWWLCSVMCLLPLSLSFPYNPFTAPSVTLRLYVLFKHPVFSNENRKLCYLGRFTASVAAITLDLAFHKHYIHFMKSQQMLWESQSVRRYTDIQEWLFHIWDLSAWKVHKIL